MIRLIISIMKLKSTFYHPFILSYLSFHVIFNYLWFSFDDLFDLDWCKLYWNSPKTLNLNPRHWCASKLKFYFFDLINFNKLLNKWTKTINVSCSLPLIELTNHMWSHSVWLSTAPKLEKCVTCPWSISKNQTLSAWNLLCLCHVCVRWRRIATYISGR